MKKKVLVLTIPLSIFLLSCSSKLIETPELKIENIKESANKKPIEFSKYFASSIEKYKDTFYLGELHSSYLRKQYTIGGYSGSNERVMNKLNNIISYYKRYCDFNNGYSILNLSLWNRITSDKIINRDKIKNSLIEKFKTKFSENNIPSYYRNLASKMIDEKISKDIDFLLMKTLSNFVRNTYRIEINPELKHKRNLEYKPIMYKFICLDKKNSFILGTIYSTFCLSEVCHESYYLFLRQFNGEKTQKNIDTQLIEMLFSSIERDIKKAIEEDKETKIFITTFPNKYKHMIKSVNIYKNRWLWGENEYRLSIEFFSELHTD